MSRFLVYSAGFFPLNPLRLTIVVFKRQNESLCRMYLIESAYDYNTGCLTQHLCRNQLTLQCEEDKGRA